jgi:hypothetical protein
LLTLVDELELKVPLVERETGSFLTSITPKRAEVLDVYAVEFSKTAPRAGYPRKRPPLTEAPGKK